MAITCLKLLNSGVIFRLMVTNELDYAFNEVIEMLLNFETYKNQKNYACTYKMLQFVIEPLPGAIPG